MGRKYSFAAPKAFTPHYNISVGRYVNTQHEFNEALKDLSARATERTGIPHNYVPVDLADSAAYGIDGSGDDEFYRRRHDDPVDDPDARAVMNG